MIPIIFYAGTHGNFVEFVLNKIMRGDKIHRINPLGGLGTSHSQRDDDNYLSNRLFECRPTEYFDHQIVDQPFIKIDFDSSEDIFVIQLNLKRGEDYNIDPDNLEQDTYQKLFGKYGYHGKDSHGPDKIIDDINKFTDLTPYYNIKDESWPAINSVDDFYNLPTHILDECINVFGYKPIQITESRPHAPRWVLRSIFKSWFYNQSSRPSTKLSSIVESASGYKLQLKNLYDINIFKQEIINIGKFFNIEMNLDDFSDQVHQQFIDMIPYQRSKFNCERIINSINNQEHFQITLNVVEEGYVDYCLEQKFGITMPEETEQYFMNTNELSVYINYALSSHPFR
jgi:hypothetical protein